MLTGVMEHLVKTAQYGDTERVLDNRRARLLPEAAFPALSALDRAHAAAPSCERKRSTRSDPSVDPPAEATNQPQPPTRQKRLKIDKDDHWLAVKHLGRKMPLTDTRKVFRQRLNMAP